MIPVKVISRKGGRLLIPSQRGGLHTHLLGGGRRKSIFIHIQGVTYFDRNIIRSNWTAINESPLKRAGLLVRKIAIQSIRHVGYKTPKTGKRPKASKANQHGVFGPPRSRAPGRPFKLIYSIPVVSKGAVFVGMVGDLTKGGGPPVPGIHEHGRVVKRKRPGKKGKGRFTETVRYPKRAFMKPALDKGRQRLPSLWKNSIA